MALPSFLNINTTTIPVESGAMSIMYTIKKDGCMSYTIINGAATHRHVVAYKRKAAAELSLFKINTGLTRFIAKPLMGYV